jgi:hypothetical protein
MLFRQRIPWTAIKKNVNYAKHRLLLGTMSLPGVPKGFSLGSRGSIIRCKSFVKTFSGFAIRLKKQNASNKGFEVSMPQNSNIKESSEANQPCALKDKEKVNRALRNEGILLFQ